MDPLYPFFFTPIYKRYLWGGRRLEHVLGKRLPEGHDYAESWEIVDHRENQSVVRNGPLAGWTLNQLVQERAEELLGPQIRRTKQFPLLFKFLDCQRDLSVQVHPNDQQAAGLSPPDSGKTEAWVFLAVQPGSRCHAGLKPGVDRGQAEQAARDGTLEHCLHCIQPAVGDCVFIPAGTVHALGAGLVVAEIQQSSNTTFRLFDWDRLGPDGKPRQLHLEQGLSVMDFDRGPVEVQPARVRQRCVEQLVNCEQFVLERVRIQQRAVHRFGGDGTCHILAVVEGSAEWTDQRLPLGSTLLVPASCELPIRAGHSAAILDMYLPTGELDPTLDA